MDNLENTLTNELDNRSESTLKNQTSSNPIFESANRMLAQKDEDVEQLVQFLQQNEGNQVEISEDGMNAQITLIRPKEGEKTYTVQDVVAILYENGVTKGISEPVIEKMLADQKYYEPVFIAFGKEPVDGKDGKFIYHFNIHPRSAPKLLEDGSVDYRALECFEGVVKDQLIAEYEPPTVGTDGFKVTGARLEAKNGKKLPAMRGKHIYMNDEQTQFFSDIDGKIELDPDTNQVKISNVYTISGNVDASTGNIVFKGNVEVYGNVCSGYSIETTGSVLVNGLVEAATIKAGKDVIIKNGMTGNGKGFIIAGGNVEGRFFEQANIECGGYVHANSIMNCYVDSKDEVVLSGSRGVLLAGRLRALKGVTASNIGNEAQIPTYIKVGLEPKMRQRFEQLRKSIDLGERELEKITAMQERLKQLQVPDEQKAELEEKKRQIMRLKISQTTQLDQLREESCELDAQIEAGKSASVIVQNWAYTGCSVTINGATNNIKEDVKSVVFSLRKGNVIMNYNE